MLCSRPNASQLRRRHPWITPGLEPPHGFRDPRGCRNRKSRISGDTLRSLSLGHAKDPGIAPSLYLRSMGSRETHRLLAAATRVYQRRAQCSRQKRLSWAATRLPPARFQLPMSFQYRYVSFNQTHGVRFGSYPYRARRGRRFGFVGWFRIRKAEVVRQRVKLGHDEHEGNGRAHRLWAAVSRRPEFTARRC
jgi:hypothetical protein